MRPARPNPSRNRSRRPHTVCAIRRAAFGRRYRPRGPPASRSIAAHGRAIQPPKYQFSAQTHMCSARAARGACKVFCVARKVAVQRQLGLLGYSRICVDQDLAIIPMLR